MYKIEFQNMKKLLFLLLVIVFNGFCQEKHQNKINADVINHFFTTYNSMRNFEYKYAENASSDLENSIIEYNYKDNSITDESLIQQIKANPGKVYNTILKNKLDNLNKRKSPVSDFNVKPVPK